MQQRTIQWLAAVPGVLLVLNTLGFIVDPGAAVARLGMPLLEGIARNTQVGDIGALFLASSSLILYGAWRAQPGALLAAALVFFCAALMRVLDAALHGGSLAIDLVIVEVVLVIWLGGSAMLLRRLAADRA